VERRRVDPHLAPKFASTIKAATIHHTAGANGCASAEVPEIIRSIHAYHAIGRSWGDIGCNVLVDTEGGEGEPPVGIEPTTFSLRVRCSTD
jgi:hypothetical protein